MKWISIHSKKRLRILYVLFMCVAVAIVIRLFFLQVLDQKELTMKAEENWDREIPFANERGHITDRDGESIVTNKLAPTLYFMPSQSKDIEGAAEKIAQVLEVDKEKLFKDRDKEQKKSAVKKQTFLLFLAMQQWIQGEIEQLEDE